MFIIFLVWAPGTWEFPKIRGTLFWGVLIIRILLFLFGPRFRGSGCSGLGFRVWVQGVGFRALGFRVEGVEGHGPRFRALRV